MELDSLSADIFHTDSCRLTTGDKDEGSNAYIKLVADGGRGNGGRCVSLSLSFNGNSDRDSASCTTRRDGNIPVKDHKVSCKALTIGWAAELDNTGALSMIDTAFCRYGGFRKHRIPIGGNLLYKHIAILCQNNHSFLKKIAARIFHPAAWFKIGTGPNM